MTQNKYTDGRGVSDLSKLKQEGHINNANIYKCLHHTTISNAAGCYAETLAILNRFQGHTKTRYVINTLNKRNQHFQGNH